ncbi:MAG: PAS domain S-box protein [Gallionellaceae bacterium]|nr:PAS domain S-box protein [Gallionellaceae bacterium]
MRYLANLPIRAKLTLITALTCIIALLLSGVIIITYDNYAYRTQKEGEISAQAGILAARMIASLEFDDHKAAQEYLDPFAANSEIAAAAVYAANGSLFASYALSKTQPPPSFAEPPGQRFEENEFVIFWPVQQEQRQIGSIYLRVRTEPLMIRITRYGGIIFVVMVISLLITLPVAMRLHYAIANPVYARSLIEASLDPLITINPDGKITDVNEATVKVTGKNRTELIGTDFSNYFTDPEKARAVYQEVLAQKRVTDYPLTIRHLDGQLTDVLYNASVYKDEQGRVLGVFAAARDVTAQKQAEQEIRQRTTELQTANQELEAFSYSVSHDLRAPLRGIDGWSLVLLEDYGNKIDKQGRDYLQLVRSEAQRMGQLIDDLLQLARMVQSKMNWHMVDLSALAQSIAARLQSNAPDRSVEFLIQPNLQAQGDVGLLQAALTNLLENAWKFTRKQPQARIECGRMNKDGTEVFFVRDNGVGFDLAYAAKLFTPFQRMHQTSDFPGTGIGLATVQRIIRRHSGRIWAEAKVNQGATFYFTLGQAS